MCDEENLGVEFDMREQDMYEMFNILIRDVTDELIKTLNIDFDGSYSVDTRVIPLCGQLNLDVPGRFPVISEPSRVKYNDTKIHVDMNEEIVVFMAYISEDIDQFTELTTILKEDVELNLIKIKMMNDYILGMSTPEEKKYLSCSEQLLKKQIRPSSYINSFSFKVYAFGRAFFYDEFNQGTYLPLLSDEFKKESQKLINDRMMKYDICINVDKNHEMFKMILSLYHMFDHIYDISEINKIRKDIIKSKSIYTNRLMKLLDELTVIYDIWNNIKKEVIKKFPMYANILKDVRLHCMNMHGKMEVIDKEYKIAGARIPYYDYMYDQSDYCILASMMYSYSNFDGVRIEVQFNIDELLYSHVSTMFKDVTEEEKRFHYEFTLKHEMGHIVHYCEMLYNNDEKTFHMLKHNLEKITKAETKRWKSLPEDDREDYDYWYYTFLPFERRANELMGITIEYAYKEHFAEIPLSVKRLLEEEKNK